MLTFVGLGLHGEGMSLQGHQALKESDHIYAELYTSIVPGLDLKGLELGISKPIKVVDRKTVEGQPKEILERAKAGNVAFLVAGDPMMATTHIDLRLRAAKLGIKTRVIHAASISSAAPGLTGLQSYKFGRSATVPFQDNPSQTPYDTLVENSARGLHTLLLFDINAEQGKAMTASEAMGIMLGLEARLKRKVFTPDTIAVVVARAGSDDAVIRADKVSNLGKLDFGPPPHVLIVPGKLHFIEADALRVLAGAPEDAVR